MSFLSGLIGGAVGSAVSSAIKNQNKGSSSGSSGGSPSSSAKYPSTTVSKPSSKPSYDSNIDYQAEIDKAVADGDYAKAAIYEQQRNQKIKDMGLNYGTTNKYSQYLNGGSGSSGSSSNVVRLKERRKFLVVRYRMGRPGTARRPHSTISSRSSSKPTV